MISFLSVFPPYRGGISRFSDFLLRHMKQRFQVEAVNYQKLYPDFLFPGTTQFERTDEQYTLEGVHAYNPFSWRATASEIAQQKPTTLLITYWHPFFIFCFNTILKVVKKNSPDTQVIILAHNIKPHEPFVFSDTLIRSFFHKADHIITLSDQTVEECEELQITTPVSKLFHPIYEHEGPILSTVEAKEQLGIAEDEKVVLFFGLVREYKGLDVLIKALNKIDLKSEGIRPLIVGEFYVDKEEYIQLIDQSQREQYLIIDRFVNNSEIAGVFKASDVLVLPYKSASQSGVFADAINFQVPTIASNHPGLTEHIQSTGSGLIFKNLDEDDLLVQLKSLLGDEEKRAEIHDNLAQLKSELSWSNFLGQLEKIMKDR